MEAVNCAILVLFLSAAICQAAPTWRQARDDTGAAADGPQDPRWSLVTGLSTTVLYNVSEKFNACMQQSTNHMHVCNKHGKWQSFKKTIYSETLIL